MASYVKRNSIRLSATFSVGSTPTDPTAVFLEIRQPNGTLTTLQYGIDGSLVRVSAGVYRYDYNAANAGDVGYRWYSTGVAQAASESRIYITDNIGG